MDATFGSCWGCKSPTKGIKCENCNVAEYCSIDCRIRYRHIHTAQCRCCIALSTCSGCKKKSRTLKKCSRCYSALYCNTRCQCKHWRVHKLQCDEFIESTTARAIKISEVPNPSELPQYLGSTIAEDYLNIYNNEGVTYNSPLKLLFVGVGDFKDVIKTVVNVPKKYSRSIEFVLTDFSPHIIARNLLFLYCALVAKNPNYLIQIWYSVRLTSRCLKFLVSVLKTMITLSKEEILDKLNSLDISDSDYNYCKEVWSGWLRLASNKKAMEKIIEFRRRLFVRIGLFGKGLMPYLETAPKIHQESLQVFFASGTLLATNDHLRTRAIHGNPTMTCFNPLIQEYSEKFPDITTYEMESLEMGSFISADDEMIYSVKDDVFVFQCWDYLDVKKESGEKPDINQMYISYLSRIYAKFCAFTHLKNVRFRFIIGDIEEVEKNLSPLEKFDRVAITNQCSYFSTSYILAKVSPYLNFENKHSLIVYRYEYWPRLNFCWDTTFSADKEIKSASLSFSDIDSRPELLYGVQESSKAFVINTTEKCKEDYLDTYSWVFKFLLADSILDQDENKNTSSSRVKIKVKFLADEARKFGLIFRDFRTELNRVIPFIRESNIRRVSVMRNNFRYIEWHHFSI